MIFRNTLLPLNFDHRLLYIKTPRFGSRLRFFHQVQTSLLDPLDRATELLGSDMEDEGRGAMLLYQLNSQDHN